MVIMTTMGRTGPLTRDDLELLRDAGGSGVRYELLDGSVVVTPSAGRWHQTAAFSLARLLHESKPAALVVLMAPFDVALSEDTVLQPDILVAWRTDLTDADLPAAPVLAVEVLSPSTRRIDLTLKWDRLRQAGCPAYWVVDPLVPSITVWQLRGESYDEVLTAQGGEPVHLTIPFALQFTPAELLED